MSDHPVWSVGDDLPEHMARLRNAVARELHAQLAMRNEMISLADIPEAAYAVATQLGHEFRIEWTPRWADDETSPSSAEQQDRATSGM